MRRIALGLVSLAGLVLHGGCATASERVGGILRGRGEVIKEYDRGDDHYMVIKEGGNIVKHRIFDYTVPGTFGKRARSEIVYVVDPVAKGCFGGPAGSSPADCNNLKSDPDLTPFLTW